MRIRFKKMNGAGNDFVMIDNREALFAPARETIKELCDRRRGIGADGLILIERAPGADFRMRYFNSDGGEAAMCGNGARCAAVFAVGLSLGRADGDAIRLSFTGGAGRMEGVVRGDRAAIAMPGAGGYEASVSLPVEGGSETVHVIDTGVPHAVAVEKDWTLIDDERVEERGRRIRRHTRFSPGGVNVDFVSVSEKGVVRIRTYERGVEAETPACGTGAVAAAVVLAHLGLVKSPVHLLTLGRDVLEVSFSVTTGGADNVVLEGPAATNFEGFVEISNKE